jgi:hypothetical protein
VTVTLPQRTLDLLQDISADRAKAIVKVVDAVTGKTEAHSSVELVEASPGIGVLVMPFHQGLQDIPWLTMIEIAPGRHLLAIVPDTPIERVEVAIGDILLAGEGAAHHGMGLLQELLARLRDSRRNAKLSKAAILCITTT